MSTSLFGWPMALWRADPANVWKYNGLDAYVYLRYLRMMIKILLPISNGSQQRLAAHLVAAWLFTAWICYNLQTEMKTWVTLRQRHLVSQEHSSLPQSRTVLITGIPNKCELTTTRLEPASGTEADTDPTRLVRSQTWTRSSSRSCSTTCREAPSTCG
jgi:hypothetical protein